MASAAVTRDLPPEVLEQLRILDLELEEGDITQKGYDKKKSNLLQAFGLSESTPSDHEALPGNHTTCVAKEDEPIQSDTLMTDVEPEPSAADVVDFLDYLPSPTHSPKQPEHGAALMEENHQKLKAVAAAELSTSADPIIPQLQQQQQQQPHPQSPAFQNQGLPMQAGPRPPGPAGTSYIPVTSMASPRPSWAYDPRSPRPPYPQATYPPPTIRPPYAPYHMQPRPTVPSPYNRPPPPPTNMAPYGARPMYPSQQRPMYPHQQMPGAPRPVYPAASGMMPTRPMPSYGSPRPINNMATFTTAAHGRHNRTSSLESGSEANTLLQNQNMDTQSQVPIHLDDWETGSASGNWRVPSGRAPSIISTSSHSKQQAMRSSGSHYGMIDAARNQISRRSSLTLGRSKYGNSYMATSFKAIEPAPQPKLLLDVPAEQMLIADMAGRQLLPLEAREIPFELLDASDHNNLSKFSNLAEILRYRATRGSHARSPAFTVVDGRGKEATSYTWEKLNARAEKVAHLIREKSGLHAGDRVALIYRKSEQLDFIVAMLGCFLAGMVAVPINAAEEVAELSFILNLTNAYLVLTTEYNLRAFTKDMQARSIEFPPNIDWWKTDDFGSWYPRSKSGTYPAIKVPELAYVEYAKAANGELKGVAVNHKTIMSECAAIMGAMTETVESTDSNGAAVLAPKYGARGIDCMVTYLEHRQQVGLVLSVLWSIFAGCHTIFCSSSIIDTPAVWIYVLSKYKATIALADYQSMKQVTKYYQAHTKEVQNQSKKVSPDLSSLQYLMIDTIVVRPELNEFIANFLLKPLKSESPLETVCPVASLPEHGGTIISFRDNLGSVVTETAADEQQAGSGQVNKKSSREIWEYVLDADSLKMNKVVVLAAGNNADESQTTNEPGRVRVAAFGFAMPEVNVAIVDPETCILCPPDAIGEIWLDAPSISGGFWALPKHTEAIFHARPIVIPTETLRPEIYNQEFLRTGLVGTLIGGRLVIFGSYEDRIRQQRLGESFGIEEVHFADHLLATIQKHARIEQCCIFDIPANDQHLPIVVCESGIPRSELPSFSSNISEILQSYHGLRVYAVAVLAPNSLSRQSKHGRRQIHPLMVKRAFLAGQLSIRYLKMDVDRTVFDLAANDDPINGVWRSAMAYEKAINFGLIVPRLHQQHTGMESVREVIDERTDFDLTKFGNIIEILLWRTRLYPEETAFVSVTQATSSQSMNTKPYSWKKINNKIAAVANFLMKKGFKRGRKALVLVPFGVEWIQAIYACFVLGVIPVPFEPADPQQHPQRAKEDILALAATIRDLDISYIIINSQSDDIMKNKHVVAAVKHMMTVYRGTGFKLPDYTNISKASSTKKMLGKESGLYIKPEWASTGEDFPALITVHRTADGDRFYSSLGHETLLAQCRTQKMTCQMKAQRSIVGVGLGAYDGLGLLHYGFCGVYIGSPTIMLSVDDFYMYPAGFFELLQRYKAKDVCASHLLLQYAMNRTNPADQRSIALQTVQNLMLVTDSRPKPVLYQSMLKHFGRNHLEKEAINTVYSHVANPMITTRSYMLIEPITLLVDTFWLRKGVVRPLPMEEDAHGLLLHDSGIVPSNTMVAIVNPETGAICPSNTVGEIWVASDCNVKTLVGLSEHAHASKFEATINGGDPRVKYMRTGDLGFLWNVQRRVDQGQPLIEEGQCLFLLGSMNDAIYRNGLLHFALDIELTVERCHPGVAAGGCIVFQAEQEIVAVAAIKSKEQALSAVPLIVTSILENHSFLVDTVVIVHSNQLPRTRYGDKQRGKAKTAFMEKTLPVLYVSRINNQHEPLTLPKWGQSQLGVDNDVGSVVSMHTNAQHSTGAASIADITEFDKSDGAASQLGRRDTMSSRQSGVPDSPAVTHISYNEEARNI